MTQQPGPYTMKKPHIIEIKDLGPVLDVQTRCPGCRKLSTIRLDKDAFKKWQSGALIQETFPELDKGRREQLITGYCQSCWDRLFADL